MNPLEFLPLLFFLFLWPFVDTHLSLSCKTFPRIFSQSPHFSLTHILLLWVSFWSRVPSSLKLFLFSLVFVFLFPPSISISSPPDLSFHSLNSYYLSSLSIFIHLLSSHSEIASFFFFFFFPLHWFYPICVPPPPPSTPSSSSSSLSLHSLPCSVLMSGGVMTSPAIPGQLYCGSSEDSSEHDSLIGRLKRRKTISRPWSCSCPSLSLSLFCPILSSVCVLASLCSSNLTCLQGELPQ